MINLTTLSDDELLVAVALILSKPTDGLTISERDWKDLAIINGEIQCREVRRLGYIPVSWGEA